MYFVYVLINIDRTKTYVGFTNNLSRRIEEHNQGKVKSTRLFLSLELMHFESFESGVEARKVEKFYKTTSGRRKLKVFVENWKAKSLV